MRNHPGEAVEMEIELQSGAETSRIIRPAELADIPAMLRLINGYAAQAIMLPRTELELCEGLREFLVAIDNGELIGCGALHFYTLHMAELRSLAVSPNHTRSGAGQRLVRELLEQARQYGIDIVFLFTYVPGFFLKLGFQEVDRAALPLKTWKDCLRCPHFQACDEIAMAYLLTPGAEIYMSAQPPTPEEIALEGSPLLPILSQPRILDKS
ncbi:MAG: N-acetyltransferase [Acidobacteria bacterium]|nr:N-acetyltransferase [Acidobacteriota bacterium]